MEKNRIINKQTNKDVTDDFIYEYKRAQNARTDIELYRAFGNHESTTPSDSETKLIMIEKLIHKYF